MTRTCPNCNKPVDEDSYYFCSLCGARLGEEQIKRDFGFRTKTQKFKLAKKSSPKDPSGSGNSHVNKRLLIGLAFVFLSVAFLATVIGFTMSKTKKPLPQVESGPSTAAAPVKTFPNTLDLELPQKNMDLTKDDYLKYVPYGNYFYILGGDAKDFYTRFFGFLPTASLLAGVSEYIEGKFILIGGKEAGRWYLTSVLFLQDGKSAGQTFEAVAKEGWFVAKVGDVLVMTEKEDMLVNIRESSQGAAKNISQHPRYRMEGTPIPSDGQLLYVNLDSSTSPLLELIQIYSPSHDFIEAVKEISSLSPTKFVIRNNRE